MVLASVGSITILPLHILGVSNISYTEELSKKVMYLTCGSQHPFSPMAKKVEDNKNGYEGIFRNT